MITRYFFRKTALAVLFCAFPSFFLAQVELELIQDPLNVEFIQPQEGIIGNNMIDNHIDSYGFVWIATLYGLYCYDGYGFKSYRSDNNDPTSLPDDRIHHIHEDRSGHIWISTARGFSRLNRGAEDFTTFYPNRENLNSPDNFILYIKEDSEGRLWIFTSSGLFSFNGTVFQSYKQDSILHVEPYLSYYSWWPESNRYYSWWSDINFKEDKKGNIWISGTKGGLKRYDREEGRFQHYKYDPEDKNGLRSELTVSVNIDMYDSVWVSTWGGGLFKLLDEEKGTFRQYVNDPDDPNSILSDRLEQVYVEENGNLWVLGESGFSRYKYGSDDFTAYKIPFNPEPYSYENVLLKLRQDETGMMWIVSENCLYRYEPGSGSIASTGWRNDIVDIATGKNGIVWYSNFNGGWIMKIDPQNKPFRQFSTDEENSLSIRGEVNAVFKDKSEALWVGYYWTGLDYYNPDYGRVFHRYQNNPDDRNSISHNMINVIFQDSENTIWVGTTSGLNKLLWSGKTYPDQRPPISFISYLHDDDVPTSICYNSIEDIIESSNGDLWISTIEGVDILDRKTNIFKHILKDPDDFQEEGFSFNHYPTVLYEDIQGYMWIGTYYGGLFKYNMKDSSLVSYRNIPGDINSISDNCIRQIGEDKWGRLWLGTLKGLNLFNQETETFTLFDRNKGFPGEMLKGLLFDDHGNLWASYDGGISKLMLTGDDECLEDPEFYHFDESDGISGVNFNRYAYFKSSSGELYFGGNGLTYFHPDSIEINKTVPPVYITSFSKNYQRANFDKAIFDIDEISIKYKDNVISFEFLSLNYTNSQKNQYAYMLEGFDKDWIYCGTEREAKYTNISPGKYTFRVKGSNNDGIWNEEGKSIRLVVKPPWYRTILAYFIYVIVLVLLVFGYVRRRTYLLKKENVRLDTLVKKRTTVIEEQKEEIMATNTELEEQKEEIMTINTELTEQKEEIMATNTQLEEQKEELEQQKEILEQQKEELEQQKEELQITLDRLKETQAQLIQSEKLAALGGMVAGVAHEINTPVGISVTAASSLMEESQKMADKYKENKISRAEFKDYLNDANQSAKLILSNMERTAEMVQSFKQVSADQSTSQKRKFLLKSYTQDVIRSLYPKLKTRKIKINLDIDEKIELDSYPGAFSQIITNLVLNSLIHGFEEEEEGRIDISAERKDGQLNIEYKDTGKGIEAASLEHIFEPFYTTNKKSGTGLGLHIVYNLVTQKLMGSISCESKIDTETKFIIEIP